MSGAKQHPGPTLARRALLAAALLAACGPQVEGEEPPLGELAQGLTTTSFQNGLLPTAGYAGQTDTTITAGFPSDTFGSENTVYIDGDDFTYFVTRGLLRWTLTGIPAGSVVESVSLTVNMVEQSNAPVAVYGVRQSWSETTATWLQRSTNNPWQTPGAGGTNDRGTTLETLPAGVFNGLGFRTANFGQAVRCQVQRWVDAPATNFGLNLLTSSGDGMDFSSNQEPSAGLRPKLTVGYSPAGTPSPCIPDAGVPDSGTSLPDAGRDAGTVTPDGGTVSADGGTVTSDGGTVTPEEDAGLSEPTPELPIGRNVRGFDCQSVPGVGPLGLLLCLRLAARRVRR